MRCYVCFAWLSICNIQWIVAEQTTQQRRFIPEVSLGISQLGSQEGKLIGLVEPKITWRTNGKLDQYDVEGGWEVLAQDRVPTLWPFSVWAKVQRAFRANERDYQVGARLQAHALLDQVDLQVTANLGKATWLELVASTGVDTSHLPYLSTRLFHRQELKPWGRPGTLWVKPHLNSQQAKIQIGYERPDTSNSTATQSMDHVKSTTFLVDAWTGGDGPRQPGLKCTVSRFLDSHQVQLSPFVSTQGIVGVHVERDFPDSGKLQVMLQPTELVDVTWQEGTWTARLTAPLFAKALNNHNEGIRVGLHRTLDLLI